MDQTKTSPELTGGGGFTFEDRCSALYMAALLAETTAAGLPGHVLVTRVELQRGSFGAPMDDIIVTGRSVDGSSRTLSLQVKRELSISSAVSNGDFRDIVARGLATLRVKGFRTDVDRIGAVTGTIAEKPRRAFETVCEWARSSDGLESFQSRFAAGAAGDMHRRVHNAVQGALRAADPATSDDDVFLFFRHFLLVTVNLLHEGSTDEANAIALLSRCLASAESARASELWQNLVGLAREGSGRAALFGRSTLLNKMRGRFHFAAGPAFNDDLARLAEEARAALADISDAVDGIHAARPELIAEIERAIAKSRFVQITGLPGTGKSAVLREMVVSRADSGPVLFLKTDRLQGVTWLAHAAALGLVSIDVKATLVEIAATGTGIVFIDGLDRVEISNRGVVNDVLNILATDEDLENWRVLASVRDNGVEPLRNWLSSKWLESGVVSVEVKPFSDDEASIIANARPHLRGLLFGDARLQELSRRPFFLSVLARLSTTEGLATEVDLVEAWWKGGGYDAATERVGLRQRALILLAQEGARTLGRRISVKACDPIAITELVRDGVVKHVRPGHTVGFVHDIYFEWGFLHLLIDRDSDWRDELRRVGEPPVLGRVIELLSQLSYRDKEGWGDELNALEQSRLRSQWTRAWLLGPFGSPSFEDDADQMSVAAFANGAVRLKKLAVWFQAEKTKPNPRILQQSVSRDPEATLRIADALAWPSDVAAWRRLIGWLLIDPTKLPHSIAAEIVSVFEVWQNLFADTRNSHSAAILHLTLTWLEDIEDRLHSETYRTDHGPWDLQSNHLEEIENRLRTIVLRAGRAYSDRIRIYVDRLRSRKRLRNDALEQILQFAPLLAETMPPLLVSYTLDETLDELPEVVAAKPFEPGELPIPRLSYHDWHKLAIRRQSGVFSPASPAAEPFASLFRSAPIEALRLVRLLANHAIMAWRQLHALQAMGGNPIPLTLELPWGSQTFWGDRQVYQWYRAVNGPPPVECGLMALETWALMEFDSGRDLDSILKEVLEGQECCAVLGVVGSVLLKAQRPTPAGAAIVSSARLWSWDLQRWQQDQRFPVNLIVSPLDWDQPAVEAVRRGNALQFRKLSLRDIALIYVLSPDENLRSEVQARIQNFHNTPPLDFDEELRDNERLADARRTAKIWAKIGNPDTYRARATPEGNGILIQHESPHAADEDVVAARRNLQELNEQAGLQNWARECFEQDRIADRLALEDAIVHVRHLDAADLFTDIRRDDFPKVITRGAVAGVAAAALRFGVISEQDERWARDVVLRAFQTPEPPDQMFIADAIVPDHPCLFAARGLRSIVISDRGDRVARENLLALATHPYESVSAVALSEAMACWDADPNFAWIAFGLGLRLSVGRWDERFSAYGYDHTLNPKLVRDSLEVAVRKLRARRPDITLPSLPSAWAQDTVASRRKRQKPRRLQLQNPDEFLRWDFLPKVLHGVPIQKVLADPQRRPAFLAMCDHLVNWTLQKLAPPFQDERARRQSDSTDLLDWRRELFNFLGDVALMLDAEEAKSRFLNPVFVVEDEIALSLLDPFVSRVVVRGIFKPRVIAKSAITLLDACLTRVLAAHDWAWRRDGNLHGYHLPSLMRDLLFVSIGDDRAAARFANGDWREIAVILPLVERFVEAVGSVRPVASAFLTLCERAVTSFPSRLFANLCQTMIGAENDTPVGWHGSTIPARMASLIQTFADRAQPMAPQLEQDFLRLLDALVDMGDRRSAALQISETFKDVRTSALTSDGAHGS